MRRTTIVIVAISLLIGLLSIYIGIQSLHNVAQMESINRMFTEDEEINLEDLYYHHESVNQSSRSISMIAWVITLVTLINCAVGCYLFFKSKKAALSKEVLIDNF